ncbi:uncharacterized protein CC84DRAFT_1223714 [Paraphaeosphaeria sporulosa]|uniref:FAD-binding domain-containing protein n=1 Tax=Paraphaeosphaeria sporulosa TaxID=1460663 RepID=A0A177BVH1_9PLEO|nr:uncharacterized protein CC84DRAFT_1223714 [Paraphaeosphaeria sporulosa]OAF98537.1 hypothetical protein CC84DRAFT_1223714 [Paraphaeosphaeria sporulosa]
MSASSTVFGIPELLQQIASESPPLDLIHYHRVSRWQNSSRTLRSCSTSLDRKTLTYSVPRVKVDDLMPEVDFWNPACPSNPEAETAYQTKRYLCNIVKHLNLIIAASILEDVSKDPRYSFDPMQNMDYGGFRGVYAKFEAVLRWGEIYEFLNPFGLVLGGRVWQVGTGSILGPGMTFLSQQHGWMSNIVFYYELVTGAGHILQVNQQRYPDLFWAQRAGGNNFGIDTRFDLKTYPVGPIFALNKLFLGNTDQEFMDAMTAWPLRSGGHEDVKGELMPSTRYTTSSDTLDAAITARYDWNIDNPLAFENFTAIAGAVDIGSGVQNFSQLVNTTSTQFGTGSFRWNWYSTSIRFSNRTMNILVETMVETAKELLTDLSGFLGVADEPISRYYAAAALSNGGDPYNLDPEAIEGGLLVADFYVASNLASEDAAVENYLQTLIERVEEKSNK